METFYFEAYNEPHVRLVDLLETPFERITEDSVVTSDDEFKVDMLVYATGFDASELQHIHLLILPKCVKHLMRIVL